MWVLPCSNTYWIPGNADWSFLWFSSAPPGNCQDSTSIRQRPLPFKPFPVHLSSYPSALYRLATDSVEKYLSNGQKEDKVDMNVNEESSAGFLTCSVRHCSVFWTGRTLARVMYCNEGSAAHLPRECACFMLVSRLVYYSIMNMEALFSFETEVNCRLTTWRYIPEDRNLEI
jgi:hypothetical protein